MAISTYSDLKTAIANWLNRSDLTALIPDFITLFEQKANKDIRARPMVVRATASIGNEYETLPSDYVEMINFSLLTSPPADLEFVSASNWIQTTLPQQLGGNAQPVFFTIVGNQLRFAPIPAGSYNAEMQYYAEIPALSDSNTTNWLLTLAPDAYLYGSLLEAAAYLRNDPRLQIWATGYDASVRRINQDNAHGIYNAAPLAARPG